MIFLILYLCLLLLEFLFFVLELFLIFCLLFFFDVVDLLLLEFIFLFFFWSGFSLFVGWILGL